MLAIARRLARKGRPPRQRQSIDPDTSTRTIFSRQHGSGSTAADRLVELGLKWAPLEAPPRRTEGQHVVPPRRAKFPLTSSGSLRFRHVPQVAEQSEITESVLAEQSPNVSFLRPRRKATSHFRNSEALDDLLPRRRLRLVAASVGE